MSMKNGFQLLTIILAMTSIHSHADDQAMRVARYSEIAPVATTGQRNPLEVMVQIHFPKKVATLGEGLSYLLARSGYRLAPANASDPQIEVLMHAALPDVHRQIGPISLVHALTTLAGPAWQLIIDPVNRMLSFE
ncbi:MAG: hypothetical protein GY807_14455, partial [Gammaproteobacteria bacterium]|nr:hypothetical protein [Gammaproteobacteria bacterium]